MPAVETFRVVPRQMRSALLEVDAAMMEAAAGVTVATRCGRLFYIAVAMRAAPDKTRPKLAGSTACSKARRTACRDLRN
jgi:hypothetical protein